MSGNMWAVSSKLWYFYIYKLYIVNFTLDLLNLQTLYSKHFPRPFHGFWNMPQDLKIFNSMPNIQYLKYRSPRNWLQILLKFENILKNESCNASKDFLTAFEKHPFYFFEVSFLCQNQHFQHLRYPKLG